MILVTGATGLTGDFVVRELRRRGVAVRALCRGRAELPAGVEVVAGDLRDPGSLARAARGTDGIVHTACTYTDGAADVAAMAALIAAWTTGPFVYLSSLDVYGFGPGGGAVITEDSPLDPTYGDYAAAKIRCEALLAAAGRQGHTMLRAPYIWGPHPTARRRLIPPRLERGEPLVLPGVDEAEWRQYGDVWIDVRDLAVVVAACVERPAGGPLNVLGGHFVWHDLYEEVIRATGSSSRIVHRPLAAITDAELPHKERYAQRWRFSEARLAGHLGNHPEASRRRALAETLRDTLR